MGYQTDFIGYLQILPELNRDERDLVNQISGSVYADRRETGMRLLTEDEGELAALRAAAPQGWSNWYVCPQGCCLSYDGGDKANHMVPWLNYLMSTFLTPGAAAADRASLESFTCDHVLNGMVVGSRRDNRELYSITVRDNAVEVELLWPGVKDWSSYPPLRYQSEIDRFRQWLVEQPEVDAPEGWPLWS